jgi:hypothetical protein
MEHEPGSRLNVEQGVRAECAEERQRGIVPRNEDVLTVVNLRAGRRIDKRDGPAAWGGFLFEEDDGVTGGHQGDGSSESAEAGADDHDRFHPTFPMRGVR